MIEVVSAARVLDQQLAGLLGRTLGQHGLAGLPASAAGGGGAWRVGAARRPREGGRPLPGRAPRPGPPTGPVARAPEPRRDYLAPPISHKARMYTHTMPAGVALGLGYLGNGSGSLMPIETTLMPGKGNLHLTGKLGDVIKEIASIALSWVK